MKLYWRVSEPHTGRYRSFHDRAWPTAYFDKEHTLSAVRLTCDDSYVPALVREGKHAPIRISIADYSGTDGRFKWKRLIRVAVTLEEAKELAAQFWRTQANKPRLPEGLR